MRCHYIYDKETWNVHIPGCWGGAIYGPTHCTCRSRPPQTFNEFEKQEYRENLKELSKQIRELESENSRLNRIIRKLLKIR